MKIKALLYTTKAKPYLNDYRKVEFCNKFVVMSKKVDDVNCNGKIVAECDYEVEKIHKFYCCGFVANTNTICYRELLGKSCLTDEEFKEYNPNYAIHIKNLHIFDEPKELSEYGMDFPISPIVKAPQNMMYANGIGERYILISIQPQWLCKILNGEKTIEVRKKVLKEMLK